MLAPRSLADQEPANEGGPGLPKQGRQADMFSGRKPVTNLVILSPLFLGKKVTNLPFDRNIYARGWNGTVSIPPVVGEHWT